MFYLHPSSIFGATKACVSAVVPAFAARTRGAAPAEHAQTGRTSQPTAPSLPRLPRGSEIWRRLQPVAGPCCPTCYLMPRAREFLAICWANCRRVEQWMPNSTTTQSLGSALNDYTLTVIWLVLDDCVNYNARGQISPGVAGGWPIISSPAMSCHYGAETPCAIQVFKGVCSILCT